MTTTIDNEQKTLNVPNLRFPEFEGEWEKCRFKDVVRLFRGSSPRPIIEYLTTDNEEGVNWVKIGDVPTSGRIITSTEEKITKEGAKKSRHVYVGDLILSNSMSYGLPYIMGIEGCIHDGWFVLRDYEQNFNKDYLCNLLISDIVQKQYKKIAAGGVVQNISSDLVNSVYISIPSLDEQRKIAGLLSLIDERIATQNKIIEDLKKLKSAISKYLFERKDLFENKIKLSKVAELKNGYAFQSSKYNALGKWKILTIANVAGERYVKTNECNSIIEIPYDIQKHQKLEANDILISLTGNVGRVSLCTEGFFLLNQRVGLLQLKVSEDREYIYQALSSHKFENSMIACAQGAAQMNIGKGDVENYILPYSFNKENINSVASVLKNYDKYIINEINMLSMLHSQKQYLLRQMFI